MQSPFLYPQMPFVTQMPTQEQLEALYKTIPASQDQLEAVQKQMLAFLEQQQKTATALGLVTSSAGGGASTVAAAPPTTENQMFPFPLVFALGVPATAAPSPLTVSKNLLVFLYACTYMYMYMCVYHIFMPQGYTYINVHVCTSSNVILCIVHAKIHCMLQNFLH